ncbi:MICOS complex subunit MIC13 [Hypanus sabinus]|uniref:MICOS complex subunit MIC13 n=1 Tax=Hypanus sabinus TaxID=79690 RepID=UPI0028C4CAD4|nr:MICOS complex subunit MIC13 [Hypanus sabinus]
MLKPMRFRIKIRRAFSSDTSVRKVRLRPLGVGDAALTPRLLMASRSLAVARFFTKTGILGGSVYLVYDQGLLGSGEQSCQVLNKVSVAVPEAVDQWSKYIGVELPDIPKLNVPVSEYWNTGIEMTVSFLSSAPTKFNEYTEKGWQYIKKMTSSTG